MRESAARIPTPVQKMEFTAPLCRPQFNVSFMNPEIRRRLEHLRIEITEVEERFARASGPGGQHVNKVETGVSLSHRPSGLGVTCATHRSQRRNREEAWVRLVEKLEQAREKEKAALRQAREKEKRRNRKRPRGVQERILESKKQRGRIKQQRRPVDRSSAEG